MIRTRAAETLALAGCGALLALVSTSPLGASSGVALAWLAAPLAAAASGAAHRRLAAGAVAVVAMLAVGLGLGSGGWALALAGVGGAVLATVPLEPTPAGCAWIAAAATAGVVAKTLLATQAADALPTAALLLALGSGAALSGSARAAAAHDVPGLVAWLGLAQVGLVLACVGATLAARAEDLPAIAAQAIAAAGLGAVSAALSQAVLLLAARATRNAAGSVELDRLGGLAARMPVSVACLAVTLAGLAGLPLSPGFPPRWLAFQALLGLARTGPGTPLPALALVAGAALAAAHALALLAGLRWLGLACLGRPRTPRAAAAREASRSGLLAIALLVGSLLVPGLLPRTLAAGLAGAALPPLPLGWPGVLLCVALLLVAAWRRGAPSAVAPTWDGGQPVPPPWLPFGDPATQPSSAGFARPRWPGLGVPPALAARARARARASARAGFGRAVTAARRTRPDGTTLAIGALAASLAALLLVLAAWRAP